MAQDELALVASYDGGIAAAGRLKPTANGGLIGPMVRREIGIRDLSENILVINDGPIRSSHRY